MTSSPLLETFFTHSQLMHVPSVRNETAFPPQSEEADRMKGSRNGHLESAWSFPDVSLQQWGETIREASADEAEEQVAGS